MAIAGHFNWKPALNVILDQCAASAVHTSRLGALKSDRLVLSPGHCLKQRYQKLSSMRICAGNNRSAPQAPRSYPHMKYSLRPSELLPYHDV